jgi:tetratricopeptide (TPR) repeat protein
MEIKMILPQSRYQKRYRPEKNNRRTIILIIGIILTLMAGLLFFFMSRDTGDTVQREVTVSEESNTVAVPVEELWNQGEYRGVTAWAEKELELDPFSITGLLYHGFASFYLGVGQFTPEEQIPLFDKTIVSLRRALLFENMQMQKEIFYILGKTYYHKGRYYADLALDYLLKSLENGYEGEDTLEYIGLAYGELGRFEESLEFFLKAVERRPSDILYLTIGQTYDKMENQEEAETFLLRAISVTEEETIEQKSRFLLGKLYIEQEEWEQAEIQYKRILEKNKRSADAYYYLGEIYEKQNNSIKARAEWRRVLEIDPSHYGALTKLY